ncbi:hypothetical protein Nepgr_006286 [Nepenthes gracilis]|uniref:Uncharacterized protein n=1 Tax=Nepenthes gracilis TaxID=150966 RepID=A0AAD3S4Q5_NEPGR|nr:hypothetical protein Nepgr_006286 [Nepenthes gracilis]
MYVFIEGAKNRSKILPIGPALERGLSTRWAAIGFHEKPSGRSSGKKARGELGTYWIFGSSGFRAPGESGGFGQLERLEGGTDKTDFNPTTHSPTSIL